MQQRLHTQMAAGWVEAEQCLSSQGLSTEGHTLKAGAEVGARCLQGPENQGFSSEGTSEVSWCGWGVRAIEVRLECPSRLIGKPLQQNRAGLGSRMGAGPGC